MSDISRGKCFSSNRESIRVVADSKSDPKNIQHMIKTKKADILSRLGGECFRALAGIDRH